MKKTLLINILFLILTSCCNEDDNIQTNSEVNIPLPELKNPTIILNDIGKGEIIGSKIASIYYENYNATPYSMNFEYVANTNKIKKFNYVNPNYSCQTTTLNYFYRNDNFIDKIVLKTINTCGLEYEINKTYNYNYEKGVLKSIKMDNNSLIENIYFSYNPDGTVAEMYTDQRPKSDPHFYGYQKFSYEYDANKNVTSFKQEDYSTNKYDHKYTFTYDNKLNPFKGFFITLSARRPSLGFMSGAGPFFLSQNNITSIKEEYINSTPNPIFEYYNLNFKNNNLLDYGNDKEDPYWFRYYVNY